MRNVVSAFVWLLLFSGTNARLLGNVSLPAQREALVSAARVLFEDRGNRPVLPEPLPNPFVWIVESELEISNEPSTEQEVIVKPAQVEMGIERLAKISAQIAATGMVSLGGERILLLGQKRLKVGDSVTISFEGENHELVISELAANSFSVRYRGLSVSRPIHISSSSPTTIRP